MTLVVLIVLALAVMRLYWRDSQRKRAIDERVQSVFTHHNAHQQAISGELRRFSTELDRLSAVINHNLELHILHKGDKVTLEQQHNRPCRR
jgi:Flp pilus assembly protein TadB